MSHERAPFRAMSVEGEGHLRGGGAAHTLGPRVQGCFELSPTVFSQ